MSTIISLACVSPRCVHPCNACETRKELKRERKVSSGLLQSRNAEAHEFLRDEEIISLHISRKTRIYAQILASQNLPIGLSRIQQLLNPQ